MLDKTKHMVLLQLPGSPAAADATNGSPSRSFGRSSSTSMLPQIGRSHAASRAAGEFPLGLSPADRSLLPMQQKQRRAKAVSCQTESTELADLRQLQQQLFDVRQELSTVNAELSHAERRLRHEVREEMEERMHKFERRTMEKVQFLKQRQVSSVTTMRKASKAQLESAKVQTEHALRTEAEAKQRVHEETIAMLRQDLEQKDLLIAGYKRDNATLKEKLDILQLHSKGEKKGSAAPSQLDVAEQTAQLEAQLASRDATIQSLRDQLARMQQGGGGASTLAPSKSAPNVGKGKKK